MSKYAAIILSRQRLRPSLSNSWVKKISDAVKFVRRENLTLISSVGSRNWEIITACAVLNSVPLKLVLPVRDFASFEKLKAEALRQYRLANSSDSTVKFDYVNSKNSNNLSTAQLVNARDETIINKANILIPVSVRPGGNMSKLLLKSKSVGKTIIREFETEYEKKKNKLAYQIDINALSEKLEALDNKYLIHWTRATNCRWPDENSLEFYKTIFDSDKYRRTAFDTLHNILSSQSIIASSKNMPANTKAVCFSGLVPKEAAILMKWRARYCQMSFEPFGIGIEKNYAMAHGIKEVHYYDHFQKRPVDDHHNWWWQSSGQKTDWRNEKEFRHKGDFDFSRVPKDKLIAFCQYEKQAGSIRNQTGLQAMSFYN